MSADHVAQVIGKAATDSEFKSELLSNPEAVLQNYELTSEEKEALMNLSEESLSSFTKSLDQRITKGFTAIGG